MGMIDDHQDIDAVVVATPDPLDAPASTWAMKLGNVAYRTGKTIEWDAKTLSAKHCPEAAGDVRRPYRKGWEV